VEKSNERSWEANMKKALVITSLLLLSNICQAQSFKTPIATTPPAAFTFVPAADSSQNADTLDSSPFDDSFGTDLTPGPVINGPLLYSQQASIVDASPEPTMIVVSGADNPDEFDAAAPTPLPDGALAQASRQARADNVNAPKAKFVIDQDDAGNIRLTPMK
jgi:hypothetical protein